MEGEIAAWTLQGPVHDPRITRDPICKEDPMSDDPVQKEIEANEARKRDTDDVGLDENALRQRDGDDDTLVGGLIDTALHPVDDEDDERDHEFRNDKTRSTR
jgi:hypothetical protein